MITHFRYGLQVDGDTSTNDTVIALASGLSGSTKISTFNSNEAVQLQACLDVVSSASFDCTNNTVIALASGW